MDVQEAYDQWAEQYDTNQNKTRDLEAISLRESLTGQRFERALEIGCGTGKNTEWLLQICDQIVCIDLSGEMLARAKAKLTTDRVTFQQADIINKDWDFANSNFDLVVFSLVLEHIDDLVPVLRKTHGLLKKGGKVYIGELHPFKQYNGTKARFETGNGVQVVTCFNHHISDFTDAAKKAGLAIESIKECFDDNDHNKVPRILTMVLTK